MNIYIFANVGSLTDNYHAGGSAAIIAQTQARALELLPYIDARFNEPESGEYETTAEFMDAHTAWRKDLNRLAAKHARDTDASCHEISLEGDYEERIWVFADSGCC